MFPSWAHLATMPHGVQETRLEGVEYRCWNVGELPTDWLVEWANTVPHNDHDVAAAVAAAAAEPDAGTRSSASSELSPTPQTTPLPGQQPAHAEYRRLSCRGSTCRRYLTPRVHLHQSCWLEPPGCRPTWRIRKRRWFRFPELGAIKQVPSVQVQLALTAHEDDTIPVTEFQAPHRRESIFLDLSADDPLCAELGPRKDGPWLGARPPPEVPVDTPYRRLWPRMKGRGDSNREMILSGDQLLEFLARQNWA